MRQLLKIIIPIAIILALLAAVSGLFEDWLWFKDLGYTQLFWTPLLSKWAIQGVNGTVLFLFIAGTLLSIRHAIITFINERLNQRLRLVQNMDRPVINLSQKRITIWLLIISAIISYAISFLAGFTGWLEVLTFINSSPFGKTDPVFGKDLSFYFFQLPFMKTIYNAFFGPLFLLTFFTAIFYIVTGVLRFHSIKFWRKDALTITTGARRHLALLISILLAFKTFGYFLNIYELLYSKHGHVVGAGYTDLNATLPILKLLIILSIAAFVIACFSLLLKDIRLLSLPIASLVILGTILYGIFPSLIQSLIVIPNELEKETPYIQNEISLTRFGYGLDNIREKDYPGDQPISADTLKSDQETINNIRLNDIRPMLQTYAQKQGLRLYYKFNDIDVDRYTINGQYRQLMLGPRELSSADLDAKAQTFINTKFKYTHGFGITASFANEVTQDGLPSFAIKDVPPVTSFPELKIDQPRIYFGEVENDWIVVNTNIKEFDYPLGNANAENNYEGKTGIKLTPINKLMLSIHNGTFRLYLANEINSNSRFLLHRNIMERVRKLAPFLSYDSDPYVVIDNGRLKWIIDAYTTSDSLPYANTYGDENFNYIRNSVKVVIDAYDGTVDFYTIDPKDPILQTYTKIFPGVFKDISELPSSLKAHLRYPETLFTIQSNMLNIFHMQNPSVFYNKEDAWAIAKELYGETPQDVEPYYTIMKLPGSDKPEFVIMLPFTPASSSTNTRNNMVAWLAGRMDGDNYGQLLLYKLPKNTEIDGPLQIESRIDQDPEISKQLSLWGQRGSNVIRGNLLVIPIGGNFLYVEPIYLQATQNGSIPEMKRLVLAYQDKLIMSENLDNAISQIFGENAVPGVSSDQISPPEVPPSPETPDTSENINSILQQIDQMRSMLDSLENQLKSLQNSPSS